MATTGQIRTEGPKGDTRAPSQAISQIPRILVVEDDEETASDICSDLTERGYRVQVEQTGLAGLDAARHGTFNLMILDRMLPGLDGLELLEQVRQEGITVPVLVVSALGSVDERVLGLRAGGDDYLTKPFALVELATRVEVLLRRPNDTRATILRVGPLTLDLIERHARRGERDIELLPREFKILEYMMRRVGQNITRDMLLEDVWGYRFLPQTNLVDVHMGKLRQKVDQPGEPPLFSSVRYVGFRMEDPEGSA